MSAVYKLITTRPTLNDVFWIESREVGSYPITVEPINEQTIGCELHYTEQITWQEISNRINELRPDIKDWLISRSTSAILVNAIENIYEYLDYNITVIENFLNNPKFKDTKPSYNPFSLTYTLVHTYNTVNELSYQYNIEYRDRLDAIFASAQLLNNTIVEEFYDNGVQVNGSDLPTV